MKFINFPLLQFFYKISSSKSSNIIVLLLAQIMGMYFCSSVLMMRMNMPAEYRVIITEVGAQQVKRNNLNIVDYPFIIW